MFLKLQLLLFIVSFLVRILALTNFFVIYSEILCERAQCIVDCQAKFVKLKIRLIAAILQCKVASGSVAFFHQLYTIQYIIL